MSECAAKQRAAVVMSERGEATLLFDVVETSVFRLIIQ